MPKPEKDFFPQPIVLADIPAEGPGRAELGDGVVAVVFRDRESVRVMRDLCPHMGAPLSEGHMVNGCLQCPWHGYRFDPADGHFVENPNEQRFAPLRALYKTFKPEKRPNYRIQAFAFEVEDGRIWVRRPGIA